MAEPRVLVIDDEAGITRLCERLLSRAGFHVTAFTSPFEGQAALEKETYDLLLVDIRMPGMNGFELIDRTRHLQPELAIVIMTGFGTVETAIEALRRGANGLVLKPFSGMDLVTSVRNAYQESRQKQDVLRLQTLRPLFTISESFFTETNPSRLQELLVDAICGNLHCTHVGLYRQKEPGAPFRLAAGRGDLPGEESGKPQSSLPAWTLEAGAPLIASIRKREDARMLSILKQSGLAAALAAPLALKDGASVILAGRSEDEPDFREPDLETFAILARQAAVALENARLHAELRAYIRRVEESQRALVQAEKMATAGRLTASIAHEINNPLQSVRNCLHLAVRPELSVEDQRNYVSLAIGELERLMKTVQRMLDYYRPGAVDRQELDLNGLIESVVCLVKPQMTAANVQIHTSCSPHLKPVMVVSDQIRQVLLNLLLNSLEAMPEGGEIYIQTTNRKSTVEVNIEDTGLGIPPGERDRIFEPFFSTKEGGTGLGLAVSFGIIAAHGGSLDLVGGRGRGACFRITLPAGGTG